MRGARSLLLGALLGSVARAANPIVPNVGMADPHGHVFNDRVYIYATHDFSPNNTHFRMKNWWVWSSGDLVTWREESVVSPFPWEPASLASECWATDAAEGRDGKHYFYLSLGSSETGVVVSESGPGGPWRDPIGKPLLPASLCAGLGPPATSCYDPGVLRDPKDGEFYIVFGSGAYYIAKLAPDMVSLAEAPRHLDVRNSQSYYGPGHVDDMPFLHARNGTYYLSWGCFYATGTNPYGPFTYQGTVVQTDRIAPDFRLPHNASRPWYQQRDLGDRHASFFEFHGQWYFSCNDHSHSSDKFDDVFFRDVVISYVHYFANNSIAPVRIDGNGVGQYNLSTLAEPYRVEAENYFSIAGPGAATRQVGHTAAFAVAGLRDGASLAYPRVSGVPRGAALVLRAANGGHVTDGRVEVRVIPPEGADAEAAAAVLAAPPRGVCGPIAPTGGGWDRFVDVPCALAAPLDAGHLGTLVLNFSSSESGAEFARLDSFTLAAAPPTTEAAVTPAFRVVRGKWVSVAIGNASFDVTAFGAKGDGTTLDTAAVQGALDAAAVAGGGSVVFPPPGRYLIGAPGAVLRSNHTQVVIEAGATVLLQDDPGAWTAAPGHLFQGSRLHDVAVTGRGVVDGQGAAWWRRQKANASAYRHLYRPHLVQFEDAANVLVRGGTFRDGPGPLLGLLAEGAELNNVTSRAPASSPNTGGVVLVGGSGAASTAAGYLVTGCDISVGDDNVVVNANHTRVEDSRFGAGHGATIGSVCDRWLTNISFSGVSFVGTAIGPRIKTRPNCAGRVWNVRYANLTITNVSTPLRVFMEYGTNGSVPSVNTTMRVENISYTNIAVRGGAENGAANFICDPRSPCRGLRLDGVSFAALPPGRGSAMTCVAAHGTAKNLTGAASCLLPPLE